MSLQRPLHLMLVDSDELDTQLVMSTLETVTPVPEFTVFHDSMAALSYLQTGDHDLPDLVLMGLHLSPVSGLDLLTQIKTQPTLRQLPVVVLSSSEAPNEIRACYARYATAYLLRPVSWVDLERQMHSLWTFWTQWIRLPED